jgi:hypothetical protein
LLGERARRAGGADEHVRLDRVNRLDEPQRRVLVRVRQVVRHEIRSALHDQTLDVDEPQSAARVLDAQPLVHQGRHHQIGDACRRGSRAKKHDAQVPELMARDPR